jgi:hypothetical protein
MSQYVTLLLTKGRQGVEISDITEFYAVEQNISLSHSFDYELQSGCKKGS